MDSYTLHRSTKSQRSHEPGGRIRAVGKNGFNMPQRGGWRFKTSVHFDSFAHHREWLGAQVPGVKGFAGPPGRGDLSDLRACELDRRK